MKFQKVHWSVWVLALYVLLSGAFIGRSLWKCSGAIVGKALEAFEGNKGSITALVTLQQIHLFPSKRTRSVC